jgi:hypothetical protein
MEKHQLLEWRNHQLLECRNTSYWNGETPATGMEKSPRTSPILKVSASETSVNFYQVTRRNNPEDSRLHTRRR